MTARASATVLTPVDLAMIEDLYWLGAATTPVLMLLRRSHTPAASGGMVNHRRRLAALHADGAISRFADRFGVVIGSRSNIYAVEAGLAGMAAATRRHYDDIPADTWREIRKRAAANRERMTELLVLRGHDAGVVRTRLEQLSSLCLRYYVGETTLRHKLLASTAASILWLGARTRGIPVHTVFPDGSLALSTRDDDGVIPVVKPDLFFGLGDTAVLLEAETGTSSRAKVITKLSQYARLVSAGLVATLAAATGQRFRDARILIHCGTDAHAQLVADVASRMAPSVRALLRITGPLDLTIEFAGDDEVLAGNDLVRNILLGSGQRVLYHFASRLASPIFALVEGRDASAPVLRCTPLLEGDCA